MRMIGWLLLALLALGWIGREAPLIGDIPQERTHGNFEPGWRRTVDGWEQRSWWTREIAAHRPPLHPAVAGLLQIFLAVGALIAFAKDERPRANWPPAPGQSGTPLQVSKTSRHGPYRFLQHRSRPLAVGHRADVWSKR